MTQQQRSVRATTMLSHVKEIQLRFLVTVVVLIVGMIVGYFFYEQLFAFVKSPLHMALHYTSPAGSFNFVIKICMMVGVIAMIPVAVYNVIMFVQPALRERLSRVRVYVTSVLSLVFALAGASFAFLVIIPMALEFFFKFKVDGLEALISADDYLQFVVNVVITFVVIFQLPLIISLIDHITPLPPKKLLKAEKFIIVGSIGIGVLVPFALDPVVQLLIASPIIVLYNLSICVVLFQRFMRRRSTAGTQKEERPVVRSTPVIQRPSVSNASPGMLPQTQTAKSTQRLARPSSTAAMRSARSIQRPARPQLISDMRPARSTVRSEIASES